MSKILQILGILWLITGCTTTSPIDSSKPYDQSMEAKRSLLIGKWYGESPTKDGLRQLELTEKKADGKQRIHFRLVDHSGKSVSDFIEVSDWGISGRIYFTITRGWEHEGKVSSPDNPTEAWLNDAYEILELTETTFHYRHVENGDEFTDKKVPNDFQMPDK